MMEGAFFVGRRGEGENGGDRRSPPPLPLSATMQRRRAAATAFPPAHTKTNPPFGVLHTSTTNPVSCKIKGTRTKHKLPLARLGEQKPQEDLSLSLVPRLRLARARALPSPRASPRRLLRRRPHRAQGDGGRGDGRRSRGRSRSRASLDPPPSSLPHVRGGRRLGPL